MTFEEYQKKSRATAIYPNAGDNYIYPTLGLVGESGEVAEKIKKVLRDDKGQVNQEQQRAIRKELGDILWYIAQLATELDLSLEEIASHNLEKLLSRKDRGMLRGSGDER